MKEGKLVHEIDIQNKDFFRKTFVKVAYRVAVALVVGFLLIASTMVMLWGEGNRPIANMFLFVTSILSFILIFKWGFKANKDD